MSNFNTHRVCLSERQCIGTNFYARLSLKTEIFLVLILNLASMVIRSVNTHRYATTLREKSMLKVVKAASSPSNSFYFQLFPNQQFFVIIFAQWRARVKSTIVFSSNPRD